MQFEVIIYFGKSVVFLKLAVRISILFARMQVKNFTGF